ncbi:MAG: protein kinase [Myxococcota bacterium]|nr:protein kinase [Myxococcota bacterium]
MCPECGAALASEGRCPADGTQVMPIGEDLLLGTTIGAYRIARLLGVGGMGRVYKGVHPTIGSRVAIKVLSRECSDRRDLVERFFSEAKAVNMIRHESIVNVLDLATLPDGRPYIIMEYLDGAPLAAIVEHAVATRTPLPLGGLARLAVEVLDALAAAHAKGIVHRDLKPDNIYVTPSGRPKVLDFGIAKLNDMAGGSATRTGSLLGTPHYMAPEQAAGRPVDHRADIYAIGVILFECATGTKPFLADSLFDLLRKHVEEPPPLPRSIRGDLPPELENVILTALAKPPDARFGSAQAMSVALQHATAQLAPAEWTPITGSGTHRAVPTGGWQPTAPASWGSGARGPATDRDPAPAHADHARAARMSAPPPQLGSQSTVSASSGQVQRAVARPSHKGVWIGLAAVVLVGGGVTAAVLAGGGKAPTAASAGSSDVTNAPAKPVAIAPDPAVPVGDLGSDVGLEQAFARLDELDASALPPEARKQLDELKRLRKLPPAQRQAKTKELEAKLTQDAFGQAAEALAIEAPPTPPRAPAAASNRWVDDHALAAFKINPKRVDASAFIRYAIGEAKQADPEAVLFRIEIDGVGPDGFANLELPSHASDHGSIALRFYSPSRAARDPSTPIGVRSKTGRACEFRIEAEPDGVELRSIGAAFGGCDKNIPVPVPKCSIADVWKKAIAKNAPSTNAVANISYYAASKGSTYWWFNIGSGFDVVFSARFPPC